MNWVDYLLIAVVGLAAWRGLAKGLVRSVVGLVSLGAGLVVAFRYYAPAARFLDERFGLVPVLADFYADRFSAPVHGPASPPASGGGEGLALPDGIAGLATGIDFLPVGRGAAPGAVFPDTLAAATVDAAALLLILLPAALAIGSVLSIIPRLPLLMPLDRAGGFCFGLCKGFVFGALAVGVLKLISLSGLLVGPNAVSGGLDASRVAPAYMGFLDYVWKLVIPLDI